MDIAATLRCTGSAASRSRRMWNALTDSRIADAVSNAAKIVCGNVTSCVELVSTFQIEVSSTRCFWVSSTNPTGCCMKLLAARMK
jgi:hypothetical protein